MGEPLGPLRARKIGGSMIAKILKKSKWGSPLDAYLELTDPASRPQKEGEDIDRGRFLEPAIRSWTNKKLEPEGIIFQPAPPQVFRDWEWATVSPDGLSIFSTPDALSRSPQLLEIKAPRRNDLALWGEEGSDEVPTDALLQTHWGMMVTDSESGVVAALLGGELRIFRVKRDRELEAKMLDRAKEFVELYVLPGIPPEPTYGDDKNVLYLHPRDTKPYLTWDQLTATQKEAVGDYLLTYANSKTVEKQLEGVEPGIKLLIGDHSGIQLPNGERIDWKARAEGNVSWKKVAEAMAANGFPEEEFERLKQQFRSEPPRVLQPRTKPKGK